MAAIKHILVPTDGSDSALKAAETAGELARGQKARVTLLVVHEDMSIMPLAWGAPAVAQAPTAAEVREEIEKHAHEDVLPKAAAALGKLESEPATEQIWGHPVEQICSFAERNGVDLIVMGSHGRSGFERLLLGSISHGVVTHAPCAVTIVR